MKKLKEETKGITLIALVVTIIVMLILVAIGMSLTVGENGLFEKAKLSKEKAKQADIIDEIQFAINEILIDEYSRLPLSNEKLAELLGGKLEGIIITEVTDKKITGEYKGYEFEIDSEQHVKIVKKVGGIVSYKLEPEGYTGGAVTITIKVEFKNDGKVKLLEPKTEGVKTIEKNSKFEVTKNGLYTFYLIDTNGNEKEIIIPVEKIDEDKPEIKIEVDNTVDYINPRVKAKVILNDAKSGIDISKCKWIINNSIKEVGEDLNLYTGSFNSKEQNIESNKKANGGIYYIHVLATDNVGNKKEEIQSATVRIDTTAPSVTIEVNQKTNYINGKIKAKVIINDTESGVNYSKSKWIINSSNELLGNNASAYTGGTLSKAEQEIESDKKTAVGTYYIHVLANDKSGNAIEKVASAQIKNGYAISNPTEFQNMKNDLNGHYYVINDIDMSGYTYSGPTLSGFYGGLDGQGYTISNLTTSGEVGLFGWISGNSYIKNILLKNINFQPSGSRKWVGVLANKIGNSSSTGTHNVLIEKVGITGKLSSGNYLAGFIGRTTNNYNSLKIKDCYIRATATNGYWNGDEPVPVTCVKDSTKNFTLENFYFDGEFKFIYKNPPSYAKDFYKNIKTVKNCYYNKGIYGSQTVGTGLTALQMKEQSSYAGFDFTNTWYMGQDGYPELRFN